MICDIWWVCCKNNITQLIHRVVFYSRNSSNSFLASLFSGFFILFLPLTRIRLWILNSLFWRSRLISPTIFYCQNGSIFGSYSFLRTFSSRDYLYWIPYVYILRLALIPISPKCFFSLKLIMLKDLFLSMGELGSRSSTLTTRSKL